MLQAKGDELDRDVRRAEEELRALENTVLVINSLNEYARSYGGTVSFTVSLVIIF